MSDATQNPDPAELLRERFGEIPTPSSAAALSFNALSAELEDVDAVLVVMLASANHVREFAGGELVAVRALIALSRAGDAAMSLPIGHSCKRTARELASDLISTTGRAR